MRNFLLFFSAYLLIPAAPAFAEANFDSVGNILMLDSVSVGGVKYGNLRIQVNQLGAVTTLPSYVSGGNSYDPKTQILTLPYITVGGSSYNNISAVLANITLLNVVPDETAAAATRIAAYAQGTYTLSCNYFDPAARAQVSGSQTVTVSSTGTVSGTGVSTFISQPSDTDYQFSLSDSPGYGIGLYNTKASLQFNADGTLAGNASSSVTTPNGQASCTPVSGKMAQPFSGAAFVSGLANSATLTCFSTHPSIAAGRQAISVLPDGSITIGSFAPGKPTGYNVLASPAGLQVSADYGNNTNSASPLITVDTNTGLPSMLTIYQGTNRAVCQ